ncbi:MAG: hypothetical protein GEV11_03630 [Streptosporangiales bacterium]|nr:hypothetical protein [Streptosporangiales bacterium]
MELKDAALKILEGSAAHPDLMRRARYAYEEFEAGRSVHHVTLTTLLKDATVSGVLAGLRDRDARSCDAAVTALAVEIDRQAPVGSGR